MDTQTSGNGPHIAALPLDTLLEVMRHTFDQGGPFAISSLSRTCKCFHLEGVKLLLGQRLYLRSERQVTSFCLFMLAERTRFSMLRGRLTFGVRSISEPTAALLIDCLRHVTDLPSLYFSCTNTFLGPHPHLLAAFAGLTCLTELGLTAQDDSPHFSPKRVTAGPARYYVTLLRTACSPLRSVFLDILAMNSQHFMKFTYLRSLDPIWLLSRYSDTLKSIHIEDDLTVDASTVVHKYPYVTTLTLPDNNIVHHIHPFIVSFPALRSLRLHGSAWVKRLRPGSSLALVTARHGRLPYAARQRNKQDQVAFGSWTTLQEVFAPTLDLYKFGFTCRIPSMHIVWMGGVPADEGMMIREAVQDASPSTLRMITRMRDTLSPLEHAFRHPGLVWSLTRLELKLNMDFIPFHPKEYLEGIAQAIESLPLVSIAVEIKCAMDLHPPSYWSHSAIEPCLWPKNGTTNAPDFCHTMVAMETQDIPGHLWNFLSKISTLRRATIAWGRCRVEVPYRVVTLDLERIPQITERPHDPRKDSDLWKDVF